MLNAYYYNCLTAVFQDEPESASSLRSSSSSCSGREPLWISGMGFLRQDVLPVTQPSVSKHWREHEELTLTSGLTSAFLIHHQAPGSAKASPQMPLPHRLPTLQEAKKLVKRQINTNLIMTSWCLWRCTTKCSVVQTAVNNTDHMMSTGWNDSFSSNSKPYLL